MLPKQNVDGSSPFTRSNYSKEKRLAAVGEPFAFTLFLTLFLL